MQVVIAPPIRCPAKIYSFFYSLCKRLCTGRHDRVRYVMKTKNRRNPFIFLVLAVHCDTGRVTVIFVDGAREETRTLTLIRRRILSPLRLPFRHSGTLSAGEETAGKRQVVNYPDFRGQLQQVGKKRHFKSHPIIHTPIDIKSIIHVLNHQQASCFTVYFQ